MQLNNLESAWRQLKLLNSMDHIESREILAIIESPDNMNRGKLQRLVFNMIMFVILTIVCQSG
jgi:hypothetical protein